MNTDLMFSSKTDLWETPQEIFDKLNSVFSFKTDVCAIPENAKCQKYFTPEDNGLEQEWTESCWMNPPYGREIKKWVKKAYESAKINGATVVCLLPSRTETLWWQKFCAEGEVHFLRGRLRFSGQKNCAPFPSAIVQLH
jgi:phage N-6-adenine-methyltransferase